MAAVKTGQMEKWNMEQTSYENDFHSPLSSNVNTHSTKTNKSPILNQGHQVTFLLFPKLADFFGPMYLHYKPLTARQNFPHSNVNFSFHQNILKKLNNSIQWTQ